MQVFDKETREVQLWCTACKPEEGETVRLQPVDWYRRLSRHAPSDWHPTESSFQMELPSTVKQDVEGRVSLTENDLRQQLRFFKYPSSFPPGELDKKHSTLEEQVIQHLRQGRYPVVSLMVNDLDPEINNWWVSHGTICVGHVCVSWL